MTHKAHTTHSCTLRSRLHTQHSVHNTQRTRDTRDNQATPVTYLFVIDFGEQNLFDDVLERGNAEGVVRHWVRDAHHVTCQW